MKRNFVGKFISLVVPLILVFSLASCSWLTKRRSLFSDEKKENKTVSKDQYDALLQKYEALLKKTRGEDPVPEIPPSEGVATEQIDLMDKLNSSGKGSEGLGETVDVFAKDQGKSGKPVGAFVSSNVSDSQVEKEIKQLRKGQGLLDQNKFDSSLKVLKSLENSKVRHIRVTAKYFIGELLFRQGEYDLSMQIFEEIIRRDAFSGIVLKALGRLVVCSEKLKLAKKKERYYSILHDFFES